MKIYVFFINIIKYKGIIGIKTYIFFICMVLFYSYKFLKMGIQGNEISCFTFFTFLGFIRFVPKYSITHYFFCRMNSFFFYILCFFGIILYVLSNLLKVHQYVFFFRITYFNKMHF